MSLCLQQEYMSITAILAAISAVLIGLYLWQISDRHLYPPGPLPLPLVGWAHRLLITKNPSMDVHEMRGKYGDVVTISLTGGVKWVILNSPKAIQEGFVKQASLMSERHSSYSGTLYNSKDFGEPDGRWQLLRKHLVSVMKGHGIGGKGIEPLIHAEISCFIRALEQTDEQPTDLESHLLHAVSNVITTVLFGDRLDYHDPIHDDLQFSKYAGLTFLAHMVPAVKYFPLDQLTGYSEEERRALKGIQFVKQKISEHKDSFKPNESPRDYIDAFLLAQRNDGSEEDSVFNDSNMVGMTAGLYLAGTDSTAQTLYWIFLYLVLFPDIQEKIHTEIIQHIGHRQSTYADRNLLPYTMSVITEVMRCSMVTPATSDHQAKQDITVCGVQIPKGVRVTANLITGCLDPDAYPEPEKFKPDRFLDKDGAFIHPDKMYYAPFGAGPRMCPGKHLAECQVFLYLTATLTRFKLELGQDERPTLKNSIKFVIVPEKNYLVKLIERL